jgi:adenosine kinase
MTFSTIADSRKSTGRVIVTGSVAFDYLMRFPGHFVEHLIPDRLKRLSVSFLVDDMRRVPGGCGPNIAYGLALLGERPLLLAAAGQDAAGYRESLAASGVDVSSLVLHPDLFTASFFVSTDRDQNQIASFYTGAMARARELSIAATGDGSASLVIIAPNDPAAMERYAEECRSLGVPFLYDPSQQVARLSGPELLEGLAGAAMLIANDYELGIVAQKTGLPLEALRDRVPVLVSTHGAQGSTIFLAGGSEGARTHAIPAAKLEREALDPTGVGDAFRAGLIRGMRLSLPWEVAGRMGSVAAVLGLEAQGPQPPRYSIDAFISRYERNFGPEPSLERLRQDAR